MIAGNSDAARAKRSVKPMTRIEAPAEAREPQFEGRHYRGRGDAEYLRLLDDARRMFEPDPQFQNLSMLYMPAWNGFVEGPTWDAWWIQNSYGTTYCALPFLEEPYRTFLQNAQDLWFDQMGDGKHEGALGTGVAPDGALCDAARPGWIVYKQGDGRVGIHDWGMEFTAAGVVMQAELLLISRDRKAISRYLPRLERSANFIETRRDPKNDLFLAGPAGNLLAPSYAGYLRPDGTYGQAYLAGLSVTYVAALDRLIDLEKLAGRKPEAETYARRRDRAKHGLKALTTDEGYLIRSLDPDGTKHGVYGAKKHGYFEASPNHDAIAFRVVDDEQARRIYRKIASLPQLRPYDFILPNYPSYDDMYEKPEGLWAYGTWVNGGHWSTCEARAIMAYYRLGRYEDARRSMKRLLGFARKFRMDNPLVKFGSEVYQPNQPINLCYDSFGPAAALVRGLFEYLYHADGLTLIPHIPPGIVELEQRDPVRFGEKRLYLSVVGNGPVTGVRIDGHAWTHFDERSVTLPYDRTPKVARIQILRGGAKPVEFPPEKAAHALQIRDWPSDLAGFAPQARRAERFDAALREEGAADAYEAAHARLVVAALDAAARREKLEREGAIPPLPKESRAAADRSYLDAASRLYEGLDKTLSSYSNSDDPHRRKMHDLWLRSAEGAGGASPRKESP
jgi:hypothetical protein